MSDFNVYGEDLFGNPIDPRQNLGPLAQRFEFPPFSVLNARDGDWQERKAAWIALGIQSELGREARGSHALGGLGLRETKQAESTQKIMAAGNGMTFDPVLCELAYRWWCPPRGHVLDPFAGGSVRGIVAGLLGFSYYGIDLRAEQIAANEAQREAIIPGSGGAIAWECGDSMDLLDSAPDADFLFSCPPYGDLERYSDDPADLSTMEYVTFLAAYKRIILRAAMKLKPNRFACFVVGDFRDPKTGRYRGFVADTIKAFEEVGLGLYNDAVLVTAVGSLPIRVSAQFEKSRKLGKTHQNVLVFIKGDPRPAVNAFNQPRRV